MPDKPTPVSLGDLELTAHPGGGPRERLAQQMVVDEVHVYKSTRQLYLLSGGQVVRRYDVAFGPAYRDGHKQRQGDNRTPEGRYTIVNHNPNSRFYRSIKISYPNANDRASAGKRGVGAGDWIMVHGLGSERSWIGEDHVRSDWTQGCIAVTNEEMDEIYAQVKDGTPITIFDVSVKPPHARATPPRKKEVAPSRHDAAPTRRRPKATRPKTPSRPAPQSAFSSTSPFGF